MLQNIPTQSHDRNWRKTERVSEWAVTLLQYSGSKNRGSGPICLRVTWDPTSCIKLSITLKRLVSENSWQTRVGRRVRKWRNSWTINNAWESNYKFSHGPTARDTTPFTQFTEHKCASKSIAQKCNVLLWHNANSQKLTQQHIVHSCISG